MLTTTPPAQTGIDGAASLTGDGLQISVIFGGGTGSTAVTVNGLGSLPAFGGTVHVKLEYTPSKGRTTAVSAPYTISESDYPSATAPSPSLSAMNASDGYHLVVTPSGTSTSLAGRYQISNKNSGLALDTQSAGTAQGTAVVQATSTTGTDQNWTLVSAGSGLYKIVNQASGLLLGINGMSTARLEVRLDLGRQRHRRPPLATDPRRQRLLQDRQLQQRPPARGHQHEHLCRRPGSPVGRQRHRRPSVETHLALSARPNLAPSARPTLRACRPPRARERRRPPARMREMVGSTVPT